MAEMEIHGTPDPGDESAEVAVVSGRVASLESLVYATNQLAIGRFADNQAFTNVGPTDITGASITFTAGQRPFIVELWIPNLRQGAAVTYNLFGQIYDVVADAIAGQSQTWLITSATLANNTNSLRVAIYYDATPGTEFTFKGRMQSSSASASYTSVLDSVGSKTEGWLRAFEV